MTKDILRISGILVTTFLLFFTACKADSLPASLNTSTGNRNNDQSLLFVLSATSGVITKKGSDYQLILHRIDPYVLWFSDRPNRHAGYLLTKSFINKWSSTFKKSSPNAALVYMGMQDTDGYSTPKQPTAVELTQPTYASNTLTFKINAIEGGVLPEAINLSYVKIFIDNGDDGSSEGSTWPMPTFRFEVD